MRSQLVPMRAEPVSRLDTITSVMRAIAFEPKLDGWRALVFRTATGTRIQSRHGKNLTVYFPDIARAATEALAPGTVLDGELVIYDPVTARTSFGLLGKRVTAGRRVRAEAAAHPAHLVCFDLLHLPGGQSIMDKPLRQRRVRLERLLASAPEQLVLCPQSRDVADAQEWLTDWAAAGVAEGIVIKPIDGKYEPGRSGWHKLRSRNSTEAVIAGVTGGLASPYTLLLARASPAGAWRYTGRTLPLSPSQRAELARLLTPALQHPWPQPLPARWQGIQRQPEPLRYVPVVPHLVAEVAADTAYEGGRFRHQPRYLRIRAELLPMQLLRMAGDDWDQPLE